jgi:hypothetical protein
MPDQVILETLVPPSTALTVIVMLVEVTTAVPELNFRLVPVPLTPATAALTFAALLKT